MKNYYHILGVQEKATDPEIRRAFRNLAFAYHPDIAGDAPEAADQFILVREAYEALRTPESRQLHDTDLKTERDRQAASIRAASRPRQKPPRPQAAPPPAPRRAKFTASHQPRVYEAVFVGASQPRAHDLTGSLEVTLEDSLRSLIYSFDLAKGGETRTRPRKVQVRLPAGLYEGAKLCVKGLGHRHGAEQGDLYFDIHFAPHPYLRVCGEALFCDVNVQPWECALGGQIEVPTLEGIRRMNLPPIVSTPVVKRIPEAGLYRSDGTRSDLWVNLKMEVPPPTSFRSRRLWAELAEEYRYNQKTN